jgi:hypothetical protein
MRLRFEKRVLDLLEGAIDIHIHSAPDVYPRILNDIDLALQAKEMGMRAILIKNHFTETAARAQLASDATDFPVFGGIALNLIPVSLWRKRATWPTWPERLGMI